MLEKLEANEEQKKKNINSTSFAKKQANSVKITTIFFQDWVETKTELTK